MITLHKSLKLWHASHLNLIAILCVLADVKSSHLKSCSIIVFKYIEKLLFIIHLLGKYLLRAYYMPGTVVGPKKHSSTKNIQRASFYDAYILSSVQLSCSVVSDSLRPHESQHARPPCPSPTPEVYSNSCPLSRWCHLAISSSVVPFSSCPQSLPASGTFLE